MKYKSLMKEKFIAAGIEVARGRVVRSLEEAQELIAEVGYPVVAKPDSGVGAANTYRINDESELEGFFGAKPPVDYIMEEFIRGVIYSFDGLAGSDGGADLLHLPRVRPGHHGDRERGSGPLLLFAAGAARGSARRRPAGLAGVRCAANGSSTSSSSAPMTTGSWRWRSTCGRRAVRPWTCSTTPTTLTSTRRGPIWSPAAPCAPNYTRPYFCGYAGRKQHKAYRHSHEEILQSLGPTLVHQEPMSPIFAPVMGNYAYIFRSPDEQEIHEAIRYILEAGS